MLTAVLEEEVVDPAVVKQTVLLATEKDPALFSQVVTQDIFVQNSVIAEAEVNHLQSVVHTETVQKIVKRTALLPTEKVTVQNRVNLQSMYVRYVTLQ
jgi:hypothetical protein